MKKHVFSLILAAAMAGCASVPMGDPARDTALKTFSIAPEKSGVYIFRNEKIGPGVKMDVAIDGKPIGQNAAMTYLYAEVTPGKHTITSTAENTDTIEIDAKPGTLVYVWQEVKMGFLFARTKLHLVSEEVGKKGVTETKMAQAK